MRNANETPEQVQWDENVLNLEAAEKPEKQKPAKQRHLPASLRWRMADYDKFEPFYDKDKTIRKIKAYIEKHRHHPEYLNALVNEWFTGSLLRWAMDHQKSDIVELMLSCDGVNVNMLDQSPQSVFHYALRNMKSEFKRSFVMACLNYPGVDATSRMYKHQCDKDDVYPLTMALQQDNTLDIAKKILEHNGHPEKSLFDALAIASEKGYLEIVTLLLQKNVVVHGFHLRQAMDAGHADIVEALLNYHPFVVNQRDRYLLEALVRAASNNNNTIVKLFVDRKLDVGVALLPWAALKGHGDIVETILARDDFDANNIFADKHNYLTKLITTGCTSAALRLLACCKEIRVNDHVADGDTALILAAGLHQEDVLTRLLDRSDIEIDAQNAEGNTALHRAVSNGIATDVNTLLDHHANPNIQNAAGETPLITAVKNGKIECIAALMANSKTDVTIIDNIGKSALMYAAEKDMRQVVISLLSHDDSNVNAQDNNGDTALILAARSHEDGKIINKLLAHGADDGIANDLSHTALMVAEANHRSLCPLLSGYMSNRYQYQNQQVPSAPPLSVAPSAPPLELAETKYDLCFFAPPVANGDVEKSASAVLKR